MDYIKSPSLNHITHDSINSCKHIEMYITYEIPIKIIVLGFVGESQPTCCSAGRITVANFGVPILCSKPESSTLRSRSKTCPN